MKFISAIIVLSCLCFQATAALAQDAPKTTATRPAKEPTGQSSLPSSASPPTATQTTGSASQDATTKKMNDDARTKLETEGK
jgi:hypothetical protein